jgi:hypothetical protein
MSFVYNFGSFIYFTGFNRSRAQYDLEEYVLFMKKDVAGS